MRYLTLLISLIFIFLTSSCRNELEFEKSIGNLSFSKNTVYLDTVFTNIGSSTYTLKVFNTTNENISIPKVRLGKGQASKFRLMVDGMAGKEFENIEVLAKDSLFVFIEVTADIASTNPTDYLYTDRIEFGETSNFQKVELVTLVQDAVFIFPERSGSPNNYTYEQINLGTAAEPQNITGTNLSHTDPINGEELIWTNEKPYVIYGYAKIPENETLTVEAGARVHFHSNSGLIIPANGHLKVEGNLSTSEALENEVIFEGDRLEPNYAEVPGQWGAIIFLKGSNQNKIKNLTIKNATVGMLVSGNDGTSTPTVEIENVQIYNCTNVGLLARTGNILGKNMVINNCGQVSLACTVGGIYDFTHCTFANYWSSPSQTCLVLNDYYETDTSYIPVALTKADFKNCIFYGSSNFGISLEEKGDLSIAYNYNLSNSLIKFVDINNQFKNDKLYNFNTNPNYTNCVFALTNLSNTPKFKDTNKNDFRLLENSSAIGVGLFYTSALKDIVGLTRMNTPDIGAYNYVP